DVYSYLYLCFFFSSRRRHTRFKCDWSSDVCSSDLTLGRTQVLTTSFGSWRFPATTESTAKRWVDRSPGVSPLSTTSGPLSLPARSEERRVGKEGRGRGGTATVKREARKT